MAAEYETESAVTERGQTTVPAHIRQRLTVGKPGKLIWRIEANGTVTVDRKREVVSDADPVLGQFLAFLEADMTAHPERLRPVGADLVERINALVAGVDINLNEPLPDDED